MSERHPFYDANPKHLDCGTLIDAETGEGIRPATAQEAAKSLKAQHWEGVGHGVIHAPPYAESKYARVQAPEGMTLADWRLAVALKLKWERSIMREYRERERLDRGSDDRA